LINITFFVALILITLRLAGMFIAAPGILPTGTPNILKAVLILILAYMVLPVINYSGASALTEPTKLIIQCLNEFSTGLAVGFIINLFFIAARIAGSIIDMQVGFSMVTLFDPTANSTATYLERFFNLIAIMIFFIIDGHHYVIKAFIATYDKVSIGVFFLDQGTLQEILKLFGHFYAIGVKIALPIILVILVADVLMGVLSRTMPQLNIMILGMPVKLLIGFGILAVSAPFFVRLITNSFQEVPHALEKIFSITSILVVFADEKSEEATSKKLADAKKKGQIARSKDLGLGITFLATAFGLAALGNMFIDRMSNIIMKFFSVTNGNLTEDGLIEILKIAMIDGAILILPIAFIVMVTGVAASLAQTGFMNTSEPLKPDLKKINPVDGFKRIFSMRSVVDLLKNVTIIIIVGYVGYKLVSDDIVDIMLLINLKEGAILYELKKIVTSILLKIALILSVIGIADYMYQKKKFLKEMRMTKQEVKEEYKQMEGDPEIKAKRKQKMKELSRARMMAAVPNATVVVTNPTHFAVALKYEEGSAGAPMVVAKGTDNIAFKIKEIAKENKVPIIENKPLARLIYKEVDIDEEIPIDMYQAVAEILAMVLKMKKR